MPNYYNNPYYTNGSIIPPNAFNGNNSMQSNQSFNNSQTTINSGITNFDNVMVVPISGKDNANAYPVAIGTTVLLMDYDNGIFWIKSNDGLSPRMVEHTFSVENNNVSEPKEERNSYGMSHTRMLPHMSYDGDITYEHEISHRRGRSPITGQYVSRSREYDDYGYSAHSIADRMVACLETMYDEAKSPHEKQYIDAWIDKIRHGE